MKRDFSDKPSEAELPSDYADRLGISYTKQVTTKHKKDNGQFFTPVMIARLMASYSELEKKAYKILDPGCGTAVLTCALIENLVRKRANIESIDLVVYETDLDLSASTKRALDYLQSWLSNKGVKFHFAIRTVDFILDNALALRTYNEALLYDIIISNPPYFKLSKSDEKTKAAIELVSGQPNIYSFFMGIASRLLNENGELIFITPRSFASGNYFKAFRDFFFNTVQIDKIHLFNSRRDTFIRDSVLQETVIIKAIKETISPNRRVTVSSSFGLKDLSSPLIRQFSSNELINLDSKEKILHLPTSDNDEKVMNLVSSWINVFHDFNIQISTGPVVSFRALEFIYNNYENGTVILAPLIWLHNVGKMCLEWPKQSKGKGQYIRIESKSISLLIPNKDYILLRRFSTKDDKSRLIAAPYFCQSIKTDYIGVENKVNYIYRKNGVLDQEEVIGLCSLLNSELFDTYFQIFNGNVNVSATELREMRLPPLEDIKFIGERIIRSQDFSMQNVNQIVSDFFEFKSLKTMA